MRKRRNQFLGAPLLAALVCWAVAPVAFAAPPALVPSLDNAPEQEAIIISYAPIYSDGTLGPWTPYVDQVEGTPGCLGRGFDGYEVVLGSNDPCAAACAGGNCTGRAANGAAEGGVDPFCAQTGAAGCPLDSGRFGFQAAGSGSFATYSVGRHAQGFTAPAYAANQSICAIDFTLFVGHGPGTMDNAGNVVPATSYVDVLLRSGAFPDPCSATPVFGPLVGTPGGNVSGPFGNTTAALGNLGNANGVPEPGGFRFSYATPTPAATGSRYRFGPIDLSALIPAWVLPASGTYEMVFWNDAAGTIVSGNNQPGLWATKDSFIQGSTSSIIYHDNLYVGNPPVFTATECGPLGNTVCSGTNEISGGKPFSAGVRLGVAPVATNNNCATPFLLLTAGTTNGTTVGATNDGSATCGGAGEPDVWFHFNSICNGTLTVTLGGPSGTLSAYTGDCGALTQVACATGAGATINASIAANTLYRLRVSTSTPSAFTLSTTFVGTPPANDECVNATPVGEGTFPFSTGCATTGGGTIDSCAASGEADVYFAYTATATGMATISLCSANYDTVLAVYMGFSCPVFDPGPGFCDDDFCGGGAGSQLTIAVTAGDQWLVRISGFGGATGMGNLVISIPQPAVITAANPPTAGGNPYEPGLPYRDVLDTGNTPALTAGIGAAGTTNQGPIQYAPILVTFNNPVTFGSADVTIACTRIPCPTVVSVSSAGNTSTINLSAAIPPRGCTTLTFSNGQRVQYRSHPGNTNNDSATNTQDLLALVQALNNGQANLPANLGRYNIDRVGGVNTQDLLRLVQLLNGVNTTEVFSGATVDACPP